MSSQILVKFAPGASTSDIAAFKRQHVAELTEDETSEAAQILRAKLGYRIFNVPEGKAVGWERAMKTHPLVASPNDVEVNGEGFGVAAPNDPQFSAQWHLAKIKAALGWDVTMGDPGVVIGVMDSGIDYTHPDLDAQLVAGAKSFVEGDTSVAAAHPHGIWVSGCMVAEANNSVGVVGASPGCRVLMARGLDANNWGKYSWWAAAITWLADQPGVRVINISAGGLTSSTALQSAVNYAWNKGIPVVAAAGNTGNTTPNYPAACSNVIAVSAVNNSNVIEGFSSRGPWAGTPGQIDIAAPGGGILTTAGGGGYQSPSGTSFAAPLVSSALALVWSKNRNLSRDEAIALVLGNADNTTPLDNADHFGAGCLDLEATLVAAAAANPGTPPPVAAPAVSFVSPASGATVKGVVGIVADVSGDNLSSLVLKVDDVTISTLTAVSAGRVSMPLDTTALSDGSRVVDLVLNQVGGASATANRTINVLNAAVVTSPVPTITSPGDGKKLASKGSLKIQVSTVDASDSAPSIAITIAGPSGYLKKFAAVGLAVQVSWKLNGLASGTYTITAVATNSAGNTGQDSVTAVKA